jgi:hypothetical protein
MNKAEAQRRLAPAYLFQGDILVWRCDQCAKMFFLAVTEAVASETPRHILSEFSSHFCVTPKITPSFPPADDKYECKIVAIQGEFIPKDR